MKDIAADLHAMLEEAQGAFKGGDAAESERRAKAISAMVKAALRLCIAPEQFWRLSVREWRWLAAPADEALSRAGLADLVARFPDKTR